MRPLEAQDSHGSGHLEHLKRVAAKYATNLLLF